MRKRSLSLAAAAGFLRVAALAAPSPFAGADGLLDQAEADLGALERCADSREEILHQVNRLRRTPAPSAPKAPVLETPKAGLSLEADAADQSYSSKKKRLLEDCGAGASPREIAASSLAAWEEGDALPDSLTYYFTCLAAAGQGPAACEVLKNIPAQASGGGPAAVGTPRGACLYHSQRLLMSRLLIARDPAFLKACAGADAGRPRETSEFACRMIQRGGGNPAAVCAAPRVKALQEPGESAGPGCEENLRFLWGTGSVCALPAPEGAKAPKGPQTGDCLERRLGCVVSSGPPAFLKASAAHDVALCGDSPFCRAMMGEGPGACEGLARRVRTDKERFCAAAARWPEKAPLDQRAAATDAERRLAERVKDAERSRRESARLSAEAEKSAKAAEAEFKQAYAKIQAGQSKLDATDKVCFKLEDESSELLERGLAAAVGIEPKSMPGLRQRRQRYAELKTRLGALGGRIHEPPPAREKAARGPRGGGPIP